MKSVDKWWHYLIYYLIILFATLFLLKNAHSTELPKHCDVNLVLAMDISGSVTDDEYKLQRDATAAAFVNPDVLKVIFAGPDHCIAVSAMVWSSKELQKIILPWTILQNVQDSIAVASIIKSIPRPFGGVTGVGTAIEKSIKLIQNSPVVSTRLVIDISGDGSNNDGIEPETSKELAETLGITINGLPIINDEPLVVDYYKSKVITKDGFIIQVNGFNDIQQAFMQKLMLEIM